MQWPVSAFAAVCAATGADMNRAAAAIATDSPERVLICLFTGNTSMVGSTGIGLMGNCAAAAAGGAETFHPRARPPPIPVRSAVMPVRPDVIAG
ncbi:hypothetical protein GCM10027084_27530 [Pseudoxanthomonas sangjuensis]